MPQLHRIAEPCACGGPDIVAQTRIASDISAAVMRHQVEPAHIAWQIASGIEPGPRGDIDGELERDLARELVAR